MLSKERLYRIINIINSKSFVTINELMDELNVSKSTINRDLIELENQGVVRRERGGAVKKDVPKTLSSYNEVGVADKEFLHVNEKKAVCKAAALNVKDGDCIYIDSGTTPTYLLDYLAPKHIKLVTVSPYLMHKLPLEFNGDIYMLGGQYNRDLNMNMGWLTLESVNKFNFDHAFLSTSGVNATTGETYIFDFSVGAIKDAIMKKSKNNYLLIDNSKFSVRGFCTWTNTDNFTKVYTNAFPEFLECPANYVICDDDI